MTLRRGAVLAALVVAVGLAMGLSLRNGFVYDDLPAIVQNPRVTNPSLWHTILGSPYWLGTLWRPLTVAGFALQWWLGDGAPWVFHLVLLLGYLATGVALLTLLIELGIGELPACAATLIFLLHPVHVEAVANGVGQAELWTALALLAATICYLRARQSGVTAGRLALLLTMVIVGIAAKEQGFTAVLLLAGAEWLLLAGRSEPAATRLRLLTPVLAITILLFVLRAGVLTSLTGEEPAAALRGLSLGGRSLTFLGTIPEYARLLVWPLHLQADYGPPGLPVGGPLTLRHLAGAVLLIAYLTGFVRAQHRAPVVAFGLWWAAVTLAPVSNLLTPTGVVMAERVLFLPSIGLAIVVGGALQRYMTRDERRERRRQDAVLATILIAWGIALGVRSATRVATWSSQQQFFTDVTLDAPRAYRAWKGAGEYWEGANQHLRAIADLRHAIDLWPHDFEVNERLGQFLRADGKCAEAIPVLAAGVRLKADIPSLRSKLIECLIVDHQWDAADRYASEALAQGQAEFGSERLRVARLRAASVGTVRP